MNDDALQSLLQRASAPAPALRPADAFWGEAARRAAAVRRAPAFLRRFGLPVRLVLHPRTPAFAAALAATAAAAAIIVAAVGPATPAPALQDFQLGTELRNHGAVLITDSDTAATILWVITEET